MYSLLFVCYYVTPLLYRKKNLTNLYFVRPSVTVRHRMTDLEQVCLEISPVRTCNGQSRACQHRACTVDQWTALRVVVLLHKSCFFLLCWHNRNYVPIWTHLNDSVNCELLIRTLIINHFKFCSFWKFVCFCKLWILEYSNINKSRFVHCNLIPNHLM